MNETIIKLAIARDAHVELLGKAHALIQAVRDSSEYIALQAMITEADKDVVFLDRMVREQALEAFNADGSRRPHPAVTVKEFTVVTIPDEMKAREWSFTNFRPALKLDAKVFEKAVKDGTVPAELATVATEARAQIATDLSKYLAEEE